MPLLIYACHCTECQQWSGSAFSLSMPVAATAFGLLRGEPKPWRRVGNSGVQTTYWFCSDCGGRLYAEREEYPDIRTVRAGTLDDTSWVWPVAHAYMRSAQPWEQITQTECFEVAPTDFRSLAARWQRMWQAE
jgi:hypothetical protein